MAARSEVTLVIRARDATRGVLRRIQRGIGRLRVGLAGFIGGAAFGALTRDALNFATAIEAAERRVGVAGDTLEGLRVVAQDDGVAFNNLVTAIQRVTRRAGELTSGQNTDLLRYFRELGVSFETLQRGNPEEIFFALAEGARNFQGTLGELQAVIARIGDVELASAAGFLSRGEADIRARIEELRREGRILGEQAREDLARTEAETRRELLEAQQEFARALVEVTPLIRETVPILAEVARLIGPVARFANEVIERGQETGGFGLGEFAFEARRNPRVLAGLAPQVNAILAALEQIRRAAAENNGQTLN